MRMRPWLVPAMCVGFLVGTAVGSVVQIPPDALQLGLAGSALALVGVRNMSTRARLAALALLAGGLGVWRANGAAVDDAAQRAAWASLYGRPAVVRGVVVDAVPRGVSVRLTVGKLTVENRSLPGFLRITVPQAPDLGERVRLLLRGKLERPEAVRPPGSEARGDPVRAFDRHQVFGTMRFPVVTVEQPAASSVLARVRYRLRDVFLQALPEPAAGLYSAFLLSFDQDLDRTLRGQAATTGILHLVAISGSHIAVIAGFVFWLASSLGLARRSTTVVTLLFTTVFLALTGFPESGIRSALMAGLVLLAYLVGRPAAGLRVLSLAAAAMVLWNPRVLLGDIGFQLSVLAVWGLLAIYPLLRHWCRRLPDPFWLRTLFLLTIAAELATLPIVAYVFGRVPLIGPLTNLFAAFLFPVLLSLGGAVLLAGLLAPVLLPFLVPLAAPAANVFLGIAEVGSRIPAHVLSVPPISLALFLAGVAALVVVVHDLSRYLPQSARAAW